MQLNCFCKICRWVIADCSTSYRACTTPRFSCLFQLGCVQV